jgi:uncharacterized protein (TIGR02145 family)
MRKNFNILVLALVVAFIGLTATTAVGSYLCGDANTDDIVDISDAVYLIAYIFSGGSAPQPLLAGDANHDGTVDISDAVYLIAYIFSGGPEPNCPNQLPVLAVIGPRSVNEGAILNFSTSATDPDGTTPVMTAENVPLNATYADLSNGTATFDFNPDFAQSGVYNVTFIASDGVLADSEVVAITVNNVNRAPVLAVIGPHGVNEGANLNFIASATDPDGTTPAMTSENLPINATYVDHANGTATFDFNPDYTQAGLYNVTFIASDGTMADTEVVAITVNNVNRAPVLAVIGPHSVNEGANLNFIASATDPDGTTPAMTAENLTLNATYVDHANGAATFDFNPDYTQAGIYSVSFIASDGTKADTEIVAITVNQAPVLTTAGVSAITQTTAQSGGTITSDGGAAVTVRGVCWSTGPSPTIADSKTTDGTGTGSFTSSLTGLTAGTPYYVRAYATNSAGTGYGSSEPFTTAASNTVTDIDGNVYQTVTIGTQVWMAENLKVTHYRNGDPIPNVTDGGTWSGLTTGAYCNYTNDVGYVATYGRLYNWYAVADSRNLAPAGWHVPTDAEWKQLEMYLGMSQAQADAMNWRGTDEGGKLKEAGTTHWNSPNTGATNESGFSALPGGGRTYDGSFGYMGGSAYFWSSTETYSNFAWRRHLYYSTSQVHRFYYLKRHGFSVRCVRD